MANKNVKYALPKGLRWREAATKKNNGHAPPRPANGGGFEISCPTPTCSRKWNSDPRYHNPIKCGMKAPTFCPECRQPLPKGGYTR
jgi:hypothetical protein